MHIFNLIEYDKMVFLDADIYILYNIDFLLNNYNHYLFLCEKYFPVRIKEEKFLPKGDLFLFTPNEKIFQDVMLNINHTSLKLYDDEFIFKYMIYPDVFIQEKYNNDINIFENLNLDLSKYYFHDSGAIKYFNYIKIDPQHFANYDIKLKYNYFQNWKKNIKKKLNKKAE